MDEAQGIGTAPRTPNMTAFDVMGAAVIFMMLCWQIPKLFAAVLGGSPALTAGDLVATGSAIVAGCAATAASLAATAGAGVAAAAGAASGAKCRVCFRKWRCWCSCQCGKRRIGGLRRGWRRFANCSSTVESLWRKCAQ